MIKEAVQSLIAAVQQAPPITPSKTDVILTPAGYTLQSAESLIELHREGPNRTRANIILLDQDSFMRYVQRFQDDRTMIFADKTELAIQAVFDYHYERPGWCSHFATFNLEPTPRWFAWLGASGTQMGQFQFAEFIERMARDVRTPKAAEMKEFCRTLSGTRKVSFRSGKNLQSGRVEIEWTESEDATVGKGKVEIPEEFTIRVIPFDGYKPVDVVARFRYRINDGAVMMWYELVDADEVGELVFDEALSEIAEKVIGVPLVRGRQR